MLIKLLDKAVSTLTSMQRLSIKINPSLQTKLIIMVPHLLSLTIILSFWGITNHSFVYAILMMVTVLISLAHFLKLYVSLAHANSIHAIEMNDSGNWNLIVNKKTLKNLSILPSSFSSNILILINFIDNKKEYTALIMPDSVNTETYRKLKVLIKTNH